MLKTGQRYVAIHGHFYQPPRENPWTDEIEKESSAHPYSHWNERITRECYQPNAKAAILNPQGKLVQEINNYARISFDFGPTLLAWLEKKHPEVYQAILQADQEGQRAFGEGSALAMPYGHLILPLAAPRDRKTLILWGLRDFERRFGRKAQGLWLPETAVDNLTLEILADCGIRFTLLGEHQAAQIRRMGETAWQDLPAGASLPRVAYRSPLASGKSINLFFFDDRLTQGVAFGGLLRDGEGFVRAIMGPFQEGATGPQLVFLATDGETYGHHHRFGEMALAYASDAIETRGEARLTNPAAFLKQHPPTWEAKIVENSSWSCAHGVKRWIKDCGCHVGGRSGWNQAWRAPLREALEELRERLDALYEEKAAALFKDPWLTRDQAIEILLDRSQEAGARFLQAAAGRPLTPEEVDRGLKLLTLARCALLMFTSCGWFFDDLAGIETILVLRYAGRAIQLAQTFDEKPILPSFLEKLSRAQSNRSPFLNGRVLFEKEIRPLFYRA